jgi:hypothetical protein
VHFRTSNKAKKKKAAKINQNRKAKVKQNKPHAQFVCPQSKLKNYALHFYLSAIQVCLIN